MSCGTYLDAYSKTNLIGKNKLTGPHEIFDATGWINGYVSAYNELLDNSDKDVFGAIEVNQRYRWIASWCRDNMSSSLKDGLVALIKKYHPFRITPDPCPKKKP